MKVAFVLLTGMVLSSLLPATTAAPAPGPAPASTPASTPAAATSSSIAVWTHTSYDNVFADELPGASHNITLAAARNEYEAAQVAIRGTSAVTIDGVDFTALTGSAGTIAATQLSYNFVEFEHLKANSVFAGSQPISNPIRIAPDEFPDAMSNDVRTTVPADTTQPIWIRAYVPKQTAPGTYRGTVTVRTDHGDQVVPISIRVADVTIPDARDSSFTTDLWMLQYGSLSWDEGAGDTIELFYGYQRLSPKWWALMGEFAKSMREYRHNNLPVNVVQLLIAGGSSLSADGRYTFDWSLFDRFVRFFVDRGVVKSLEGFWMSGPGVHGNPVPQNEIIARNDKGEAVRGYAEWDSAAGRNFVSQFLPALRDHLVARGWAGMWWMHVFDEPSGTSNLATYQALAQRYRELWPGVQLSDAVVDWDAAKQLAGTQDFVIPNEWTLDNLEDFYAGQDKPVWLYNCNVPTYNYLNRFIDQPVWHQRATMWYAYSRGLSGYLHWAFNNWQYKMDDQEVRGDGWITKPDPEHNKLKATIRLESLRDGLEDRELLEIVGRRDASLVRGIADSLVTRSNRYSRDTMYMARMRSLLLSLAADEAVTDLASGRPILTGPQSIRVDLGRQAQVDAVRVDGEGAYRVDVSYDGAHWSTAFRGETRLAGVNATARYVRVVGDSPPSSLTVSGFWLTRPNLAGGRSYALSAPPLDAYPDAGDATDGVLAGHYSDGRSFGYDVPIDSALTVDAVVDLGAVRSLGEARIHRYEEYEDFRYGPDSVRVATSLDGSSWTQKGGLSEPNGGDHLWFDFAFPATKARFLKVTYTKTRSDNADMLFLDEIQAFAPPDDRVDLAAGMSYTKSAEPDDPLYPDTQGTESTDGVVADGFAGYAYYLGPGETRTVSITIDLHGPKRIDGVALQKFEDGFHRYAPDRVSVSVQAPGADFRPVGETAWPTGLWYDLDFAPTTAVAVRIDLVKTEGYLADYLFVDEIAVLGPAAGQPTNLVAGASYSRSPGWDPAYPDSGNESTDGVLAGHYSDGKSWAYHLQPGETRTVDVDFDLGTRQALSLVRFRQYDDGEHAYAPDKVTVLTSDDGTGFTARATVTEPSSRWFDAVLADTSARYVRLRAAKTEGYFADYIFIDEVEIYDR